MSVLDYYEKKDKPLFEAVERLMRGDDSRINDIYEYSEGYMMKLVGQLVKVPEALEEILQETYSQIYNKLNSLDNARNFYLWAGQIATGAALRYLKLNRPEVLMGNREGSGRDITFEMAADDTEKFLPPNLLDYKSSQRKIMEFMDSLNMRQKIVLQFFYMERMSVMEISVIMNCSEANVKGDIHAIREMLKTAIAQMNAAWDPAYFSLSEYPVFLHVFRAYVEDFPFGKEGEPVKVEEYEEEESVYSEEYSDAEVVSDWEKVPEEEEYDYDYTEPTPEELEALVEGWIEGKPNGRFIKHTLENAIACTMILFLNYFSLAMLYIIFQEAFAAVLLIGMPVFFCLCCWANNKPNSFVYARMYAKLPAGSRKEKLKMFQERFEKQYPENGGFAAIAKGIGKGILIGALGAGAISIFVVVFSEILMAILGL